MRTQIDFSPLFRSAVGFDHLVGLLDAANRADAAPGWPPYNIVRIDENRYSIEVAVAGFSPDELTIEAKENQLSVQGAKVTDAKAADNTNGRTYLHRGLAERNFERRFQLADHVVVTGADLADGLLSIHLERQLPETLKPRKIAITTASAPKATLIEGAASGQAA